MDAPKAALGKSANRYNQAAGQTPVKINSLIIILFVTALYGCNSGQKKSDEADINTLFGPRPDSAELALSSKLFKNTGQFYMDTTFPFGYHQAKTIELISYPNRCNWDTVRNKDGNGVYFNDTLIKNGKLNFDISKIQDRIQLDSQQRKDLFNLLYNDTCGISLIAACYNPRHLLVFSDEKGKSFAYIEFCLECLQTRQSDRINKNIGNFCGPKVYELGQLFKSFGIKYGLDHGDK